VISDETDKNRHCLTARQTRPVDIAFVALRATPWQLIM
jgi:hypothetical protein